MIEQDDLGRNIVGEETWNSLGLHPFYRYASYKMFLIGDETEYSYVLIIWKNKKDNNFEIQLCSTYSTYSLSIIGTFIDYHHAQKAAAALILCGAKLGYDCGDQNV